MSVPALALCSALAAAGAPVEAERLPLAYSIWSYDGATIGALRIADHDWNNPNWSTFVLVDSSGASSPRRILCLSIVEKGVSDLVCGDEDSAQPAWLALTSSTAARLSGRYCARPDDCFDVRPSDPPPRALHAEPAWYSVGTATATYAWVRSARDRHQEVWTTPDLEPTLLADLTPLFLTLGVVVDHRDRLLPLNATSPRVFAERPRAAVRGDPVSRFEAKHAAWVKDQQVVPYGPATGSSGRMGYFLIEAASFSANTALSDHLHASAATARGPGAGASLYFGGEFADFFTLYFGADFQIRKWFDEDRLARVLPSAGYVESLNGLIRPVLGVRLTAFRWERWRTYAAFEGALAFGSRVTAWSKNFPARDASSFSAHVSSPGYALSPAVGTRYTLVYLGDGTTIDLGTEVRVDFLFFKTSDAKLRYAAEQPDVQVVAAAETLKAELENALADDPRAISVNLRLFLSVRI